MSFLDKIKKGYNNATTRAANVYSDGGGNLTALGALLSRNSGSTGNTLYNMFNTQSAQASGDTRPQWQKEGWRSEAEWVASQQPDRGEINNLAGLNGNGSGSLTGGSTSGGSLAGTTPAQIDPLIFNGVNYGTDYVSYMNAINESVNQNLQGSLGQLNQGRERARRDTGQSKSKLLEQVTQLLSDLAKSETKGQNDIGSYYSGLGDIYQSSQGVRENQFAGEVADQRGKINTEQTSNVSALDQALNDYLQGTDTQEQGLYQNANQLRDKNYSSAAQFAGQLQASPGQLQAYNPTMSAPVVTDTSSLLKQLNAYLTPANMRKNYNTVTSSGAPVNSYLNPTA